MSWADYGFHGLDATFAVINKTFWAVAFATKERLDVIGASNSYLNNLIDDEYSKIMFPFWFNSQNVRPSVNIWWNVNYSIAYYANYFVYSLTNLKVYDIDSLGNAACDLLTQAGKPCNFDSREFSESRNTTDVRAYYKTLTFTIINQTFILKYKQMLDLLRYPIIDLGGNYPTCHVIMYSDSNEYDTIQDAENAILASQTETTKSLNSAYGGGYISGNIFAGSKHSNGKYVINEIIKTAYVLKSDVDVAISQTGDSTLNYYVRFQTRCRFVGTSSTEYFNYRHCALIDKTNIVTINNSGYYVINMPFTTNELFQLYENNIDSIIGSSATIYVEARIDFHIVNILDGINSFQFLDV